MNNKRLLIIWRYGLVSVFVTFVALAIVLNLINTTIIDADKWNAKADSVLTRIYVVQPKRGDILASDGSLLATNLTTYTIFLDYSANAPRDGIFISRLDSLCDSLAAYYPVRTKEEWKQHLATPLKKQRSERKRYHVLLKDASYSDYQRILTFPFFNLYKNKKYKHGLNYDPAEKRVMPYGQMARRSIGRCNMQPQLSADGKDTIDYVLHGYSGLESALDSLLFGTQGTAKLVQLNHGVRRWVDRKPVDGKTVRTTIDIDMQDIVENELQTMLQTTSADWGTCLLMEVATGDIKAISNLERDKKGRYTESMNYALQAFEPGSVMKPISMVVALEDGYAYPLDRHYEIGSTYTYAGGSPIHDTHSPASLPVRRFIEYSSNIGMTKLIAPHYEKNLNGFRDRLAELGFFDTLKTGMAGERRPYFPTLSAREGGRVSLSRMAYGYSTLIPPLYICAFYNAIANNGKFVRPRLYKELIDSKGNVEQIKVSYVRDSICSAANAKVLREMIYSVVYGNGGTAKSLRNDVVKVVGKTGTSRIAKEAVRDSLGNITKRLSGYNEGQYRLAFCGFYPYENPQYTCMVLISNPKTSMGAAPTSGAVVRNIALKMHARGMLHNRSDYRTGKPAGDAPVVYASGHPLAEKARRVLGTKDVNVTRRPENPASGQTPDVAGLSIREAVETLERAGYNIKVKGTGRAISQVPRAGAPIKRGSTVSVTFSTR